jgi:hypothetical protein
MLAGERLGCRPGLSICRNVAVGRACPLHPDPFINPKLELRAVLLLLFRLQRCARRMTPAQ